MSAVLEETKVGGQKPRPIVMLAPGRHKLFQHGNNRHIVTAEDGTTIDDVVKPEFLAHVANKFVLYDEVVVRTDDGAFWAELLVLQVGSTWVRTKMLRHVVLDDTTPLAVDPMNPYEIQFKGPHRKWEMVRKQDGAVIRSGLETKGEAVAYMSDYLRKTT